jgi:lysophospholipase L1-like esterase
MVSLGERSMIECVRFVSGATPIFMVGDSNSIIFDGLIFECPAMFAQPFVTHGVFCRGLMAANFSDAAGALNPDVLAVLFRHTLVLGDDTAWYALHLSSAQLRPEAFRVELGRLRHRWKVQANDHIDSRPVVVMVGTLDLEAVLRTLPAGCDFALQDRRFDVPDRFERAVGPYVPGQLVNDLIAERVKPLAAGLRTMRDAGLENVYLHSLHPPPVEDYKYAKMRGVNTQAVLRYKVALTINAQLRALCEREQIRFLDMWAATTRDGALDPRFEFDGDHLNQQAAELTVRALLADLATRVLPKKRDLSDLEREQSAT